MEAKANAKFVRISPRKVNVVLDLVRGKDVKYAGSCSQAHSQGRLRAAFKAAQFSYGKC